MEIQNGVVVVVSLIRRFLKNPTFLKTLSSFEFGGKQRSEFSHCGKSFYASHRIEFELLRCESHSTIGSEYFDTHPIKNVVGEDGTEIDWEGEIDDSWVKEINCLEWESFAFHPSPLVVLVFERYKRASDNWKTLKELEKAIKAVKIDLNIETDLAYALKAKECPQILFLRGNRILYREKDFRTADELVQMIAHFYYKANWVDKAKVTPLC
ncbi:PREDICTED: uncharacterized protein LOC104733250 [Camelina sativa]|uniref:Uncharacterized protein LOC104733250 n=1 Tax=Camelina sativa TaxID=90675 RepID=A0ABM0V5M2_CAMSA|nr:PREDICTED: uncharacterized protein LOC104733250 [Camelina sativa]